jgi:death-on-curing protein
VEEVIELHGMLVQQTGGSSGIRDQGMLDSALAQPQMSFGGVELYQSIADKAAALGFSLVMNHPFVDGNKRVGHAAMEIFLVLNGCELRATTDEQEQIVLQLAAGMLSREQFSQWVSSHLIN